MILGNFRGGIMERSYDYWVLRLRTAFETQLTPERHMAAMHILEEFEAEVRKVK